MNKKIFLAVPFAAALAITGCSSSGQGSSSSSASSPAAASSTSAAASSSSNSASQSATESASSSSVATSGDAVGGYTEAELEAIVTKLAKGQTGAMVMNEAKLGANAKQSEELIKSMKITPAACADLQSMGDLASKLKQVNIAAYQVADQTTGESHGVTLTSYPDAASLDAGMANFGTMETQCKSYTLEMQGVSVKAEVAPITVSSKADSTEALKQDLVIMDQKVSTFIAQAKRGDVLISATTTAADEAEGVKKLAALVDETVAELK